MPTDPLNITQRLHDLNAKYDAHEATLDRLDKGIDRVLAGQEPKADAQLEAAVFGLGPSAGFDAAKRCVEDTEPFDEGTGPMEPMDPREYNPDLDPNFGTDADIATRVREYGRLDDAGTNGDLGQFGVGA